MKDFFQKTSEILSCCKNIFLKLFWYRKFSALFIYSGILLNVAAWSVLWQLTKLNQETIILHYNAYLGIDVMLNTGEEIYPDLFLVPVAGVIILLLDVFLAGLLLYLSDLTRHESSGDVKKEKEICLDVNLLGSDLIIIGGFLIQVVIFVYAVVILFVN